MTRKSTAKWLVMAALAAVSGKHTAAADDNKPASAVEADDSTETNRALLQEMRQMRKEFEELRKSDREKAKQIDELSRQVEANKSANESNPRIARSGPELRLTGREFVQPPQESALDKALREAQGDSKSQESPLDRAVRGLGGGSQQPIASAPVGGARLQLMDISIDGLFAAGFSTQPEPSLQQLEGGDHDPHRRGFTVQNVELFLAGAVDPYFDAGTNIVYKIDQSGDTTVELEEAYAVSRSLPCGLQFKAGQYFTEFGRLNPQHPHTWQWIDQPIISSRVFGADGMRGPGMRISKLLDCEWYSDVFLDVHNANGGTQASFFSSPDEFAERAGGRPFVAQDVRDLGDLIYTARWENGWSSGCEDEYAWLLGFSGSFGPNATGRDGNSQVYGADLTMKWKPAKNERGWPFVWWETEFIGRRLVADNFQDLSDPLSPIILSGDELHDWGFYTQLLYGFKPRWITGLRYEFVGGSGDSLDQNFNRIDRQDDPFRDDRHRISPLVEFLPTEFSRFRLQYNFDHTEHIAGSGNAHSLWFGMEWLIGAHAAHKF